MKALTRTDFNLPGQVNVYHGKVRDVYNINDDLMVMVATDRISAFDVILPKGIPFKGQVLNQIAASFLDATADIVPNWKLATPRSDGDCRSEGRRLPSGDDYSWLPDWLSLARVQSWLP